jgi:hypothetical protein
MPLYVIERTWAEQFEATPEAAEAIRRVHDEVGINWLFSYLSADKKKMYSVYEASSPEAIRQAGRRAEIPADVITEVTEVRPEALV